MFELEIDRRHKAAYIRLCGGKVARTLRLSDGVLVDVSNKNKVLGIEFLDVKYVVEYPTRRDK